MTVEGRHPADGNTASRGTGLRRAEADADHSAFDATAGKDVYTSLAGVESACFLGHRQQNRSKPLARRPPEVCQGLNAGALALRGVQHRLERRGEVSGEGER